MFTDYTCILTCALRQQKVIWEYSLLSIVWFSYGLLFFKDMGLCPGSGKYGFMPFVSSGLGCSMKVVLVQGMVINVWEII